MIRIAAVLFALTRASERLAGKLRRRIFRGFLNRQLISTAILRLSGRISAGL